MIQIPAQERAFGEGKTSPADLRPRRGKGVSGPRAPWAGGERGLDRTRHAKRMNRHGNKSTTARSSTTRSSTRTQPVPELMWPSTKGYVQAGNPVQAGHPQFHGWKDVIAKAPPNGQDLAFGIPMVEHADPLCTQKLGHRPGAGPHPSWPSRSGTSCGPVRVQGGCAPCLYGGQPIDKRSSS